jgi:hypothetical protein
MSEKRIPVDKEGRLELPSELPAPIQLTPDQLKEVAGGCDCGGVVIIRKGIPAVS